MSTGSRDSSQPASVSERLAFGLAGYTSARLQWAGWIYILLFASWIALNSMALHLLIIAVLTWLYFIVLSVWYLRSSPRWTAELTQEHLALDMGLVRQRYRWDEIAAVDIERLRPRRLLGVPVEGGEAGTVRVKLKHRMRYALGRTLRLRPKNTRSFVDAALSYRDRCGSSSPVA